jgi:hypothetical protein
MAASRKDDQNLGDDDQSQLDRALKRQHRPDLPGDMEENRNLSGSTTWETILEPSEEADREQGGGKGPKT